VTRSKANMNTDIVWTRYAKAQLRE